MMGGRGSKWKYSINEDGNVMLEPSTSRFLRLSWILKYLNIQEFFIETEGEAREARWFCSTTVSSFLTTTTKEVERLIDRIGRAHSSIWGNHSLFFASVIIAASSSCAPLLGIIWLHNYRFEPWKYGVCPGDVGESCEETPMVILIHRHNIIACVMLRYINILGLSVGLSRKPPHWSREKLTSRWTVGWYLMNNDARLCKYWNLDSPLENFARRGRWGQTMTPLLHGGWRRGRRAPIRGPLLFGESGKIYEGTSVRLILSLRP